MARKSLIGMIKSAKTEDIAEKFKNDLIYTIEHNEEGHRPSKTISPSSAQCSRQISFRLSNFEPDEGKSSSSLSLMATMGSAVHEFIQNNCLDLNKFTYVDVSKYIEEKGLNLKVVKPSNFEEGIYETHLHKLDKDGNPIVSFLLDGIIQDKQSGKYYILELKTTNSGTLYKQDDVLSKHKTQAQLYSILLGISTVVFVYIGRETANIKSFQYSPSSADLQALKERCKYVLEKAKENIIVAKPQDIDRNKVCMYCNYRKQCSKIGEGEYRYVT